ncbi:hypothetical protein ACGFZR_24625 [Streptomyces sp. NPDC048241]|uniref:hypothetical protein n=1 Tax=Streptomyces sp. NPDC048241 TaxID=3365521 RepID=UPI003716AE71
MSTRTLPPHGTLSRGRHHHCTCQSCRDRTSEYARTRARLMAYGRWAPFVDAEPIRQHVHMLRSYGLGVGRIRTLSGTGSSITRLLYGMHGSEPSKQVRTRTADRITVVRPSLDLVAPNALVDGTGTRRRLRALLVVGWPQNEMAARAGLERMTIGEQIRCVTPTTFGSTARAVRALYDELWNQDPAAHGIGDRWIAEAKARAAKRRWAPPAAWDDDYIDSPAAVPDLGEHVDRYAAISEDALWLMAEQDYTREQAAHRLGITQRHLDRALAWAREGVAA